MFSLNWTPFIKQLQANQLEREGLDRDNMMMMEDSDRDMKGESKIRLKSPFCTALMKISAWNDKKAVCFW